MMEEPRLSKEIAKVALLFGKCLLAGSLVIAVILGLIWLHPVYGQIAVYALIMAGFVVALGWQNFQSAKRDFEWQKKNEERELERKKADEERDRNWAEAKKKLGGESAG